MKYIIVGLGNFGASLAEKLTAMGHEVIGIDSNMNKVDQYKEKITHTICLDARDELTVSGLPLKDTDIVIIAFGADQGANVMATATFKNLNAKRIISRAINHLHESVLKALGVDEIVHPEEETAERWAKKLCIRNVVDSFELSDDYSIIEITTPQRFIGKSIREIQLRAKYNLLALTTMSKEKSRSPIGKNKSILKVQGMASPDTKLVEGDVLVVYGSNKDLQNFINQ